VLKVDLVAELWPHSDRPGDGRLADLWEIVFWQAEVERDSFGVPRVHGGLAVDHPAQIAVVEAADGARESAQSQLALLQEPR
jgi:hypothetical protein